MRIKEWFLFKNFNQSERYAISVSDIEIEKETEKAYFLKCISDYGVIKTWVPKSCTMSDEEYFEEYKKQQEKFEKELEKYEKLIDWAKKQGLEVRKRMKKSTAIDKIINAGLEVPAELI